MLFYVLSAFLILLIYDLYNVFKYWRYWEKRGVKRMKTCTTFVGPQRVYDFQNSRYVGYGLLKPFLLLGDVDLIKQITSKDADNFKNILIFGQREGDPLIGKALGSLDEDNLILRGDNLKKIFPLIRNCAKAFASYHDEEVDLQIRTAFERYSFTTIAHTFFGTEIDIFGKATDEFMKMAKRLMTYTCCQRVKYHFKRFFPRLAKVLNIGLFSSRATNFFRKKISEKLEAPSGFIQLLSEKGDQEIRTERAFLLLLSSFDASISVASCSAFLACELAKNPEIQETLQHEINDVRRKHGDDISYETLISMEYLDQVVSEILRLWPARCEAVYTCLKDYAILPKEPEEKSLILQKNTKILVPVFSIQRSPQYFSEPTLFNPERFSVKNKSQVKDGAYQPFGYDTRSWMVSDFAILQMKALFYYLLAKSEIAVVARTQLPVQICKSGTNLQPPKNCWLGLRPRKE